MRDYVILAIILGSLPICVFCPYFGVLMWSWVAYFNPHRYGWSFAYSFPVAMAVGGVTLVGLLFTRERNRHIVVRETLLLIVLWAWFTFTTVWMRRVPEFAGHILDCQFRYTEISKILLMTVVTILLVTSPRRLKYLLLVVALSFGIRAVFGALFGVQTGGEFRVYGPQDSFIADNNAFALALNMSLPMLYWLGSEEKTHRWRRLGLRFAFVAGILSVILTYSRGGLLGLGVVLMVLALKGRQKLLSLALLTICVLVTITFAPGKWIDRMSTFLHGDLDGSAEQRLVSWGFAWNFVHDYPVTGGGFEVFPDVSIYQKYQPRPLPGGFLSSGPHSIYFEMLGEQGFVGLGLFLGLIFSSLLSLRGLRRRAKGDATAQWVVCYSNILETSLLGYMVSGAFLGLAYFDLFYEVVACVILLKVLYRRHSQEVAMAALAPKLEQPMVVVEAPLCT